MKESKPISRAALAVSLAAALVLALGAGIAHAVVINGTPGPDVLIGDPNGPSGDTIFGRAGDDRISGLDKSDTLIGGPDNDTLFGGRQLDALRGGPGNDELFGTVDGKVDQYFCGRGVDTIHVESSEHSGHNWGPDCEIVETDHG